MFKIQGTLRVKQILQSRNGPFAVGTLSTDVGEFKVKDALLDQFDEGVFEVTAWIAEIFLGHYSAGGRSITEIRARLHDLQVQSEDPAGDLPEVPSESDPLDDSPPVSPQPAVQQPDPVQALKARLAASGKTRKRGAAPVADTAQASDTGADNDQVQALFSNELWTLIQARAPVKLDSTVDRVLLRQQNSMLREQLGYRFNAMEQTFYPA